MSFRSVFKDQSVSLLFRRLKTATQLIYHLSERESITFNEKVYLISFFRMLGVAALNATINNVPRTQRGMQ